MHEKQRTVAVLGKGEYCSQHQKAQKNCDIDIPEGRYYLMSMLVKSVKLQLRTPPTWHNSLRDTSFHTDNGSKQSPQKYVINLCTTLCGMVTDRDNWSAGGSSTTESNRIIIIIVNSS